MQVETRPRTPLYVRTLAALLLLGSTSVVGAADAPVRRGPSPVMPVMDLAVAEIDDTVDDIPLGIPSDVGTAGECAGACTTRAENVKAQCLANGGTAEACAERARNARERCLHECQERGCRHRCDVRAQQVRRECLATGASEAVCNERAREFTRHCLAGCAPLQGREWCYLIADRQLTACTSDGFPAEQCAEDAAAFLEDCLNVPPATCDERCTIRSEIFNVHCENNPNPPAGVDCSAATAGFLADCQLGCQPPDCLALCGAAGRAAHRACIEAGGTPQACRAAAEAAMTECRADCANGGE